MSARRVTILEGMFLDICTKEDKQKIDELYAKGNKGSAVVYMLKRIRTKWVELINLQYSDAVIQRESQDNDEYFIPRIQI